jgi:spoIIIJ-associated protein
VPEDAIAEGAGLTLGEAKWAAVRELGRRFPGLSADHVEFEVIAEPEEAGEARVLARADLETWRAAGGESGALPDDAAGRVRALMERVVIALDLRASVEVAEDAEEIRANVVGEDLGLLIGKHGQTIDAVQQLAFRAAFQGGGGGGSRKRVVVDAAGYRERREAALRRQGDQAADDALRFGRPVALDAMGSIERRVVHEHLRERGDVQTYSEGEEPDRHLVVAPLAQ